MWDSDFGLPVGLLTLQTLCLANLPTKTPLCQWAQPHPLMCGWLSALSQGWSCLVSCLPIRIRVPSVASPSCSFPWISLHSLLVFWLRKFWPFFVLSFYGVTGVGGSEWFFWPYNVISCFSGYGLVQWIFKGIYFTSDNVGTHGIFCSCCLVCLVCVHLIFGGASKFFMVLCSFMLWGYQCWGFWVVFPTIQCGILL